MTKSLRSVLLFAFTTFAGCTTYEEEVQVGAVDYLLAQRDDPTTGETSIWLDVSGGGEGRLRVESTASKEQPYLGFKAREIDKDRAETRGVKAFSGLLVTKVFGGSGAAEGGVEVGDVLLSIDGHPTVYAQQLEKVEASLRVGQRLATKVLRGQTETDLSIEVRVHGQRDTETVSVPLERATITHRPYAGVNVRGIPADWCKKIWDDARNAVVVTSVEVGSPAWVAGVRGGDVIETIDGAPVPPVAEVSRQIEERGARGETVQWRVRRQDQVHEATIHLDDYSGEANVWVPLIFRVQNGVYRDRWSVGPFGLLLGNRNEYVADNTTRAIKTRNVFSAILGLFRVETKPNETDVRLLWFIHIDT